LLPGAIPVVTISADGSYSGMDYGHDTAPEIDLIASIEHKLNLGLLTGFVIQGLVPYGRTPSHTRNKLMLKAAFSGIPVAIAGRGAPMGFADPSEFQIAATNLTANKASFLLMACLMKFGSLPAARDPDKPTPAELDAIRKAVAAYQVVFNEHSPGWLPRHRTRCVLCRETIAIRQRRNLRAMGNREGFWHRGDP